MDIKKTKKINILLILAVLLICNLHCYGQSSKNLTHSEQKQLKDAADLFFSSGNFNAALLNYTKLLQYSPSDKTLPELYLKQGICYENIGLYDKSIKSLNSALQLDKTNPVIHLNLGIVLQKSGLFSESVEEYKLSIDYNISDKYIAYLGLGKLYQKSGINSEAINYYQKALLIKPGPDIYNNLSKCYESLHDWKSAGRMLFESIKLNESLEDEIHLAYLYYIQKDYDAAIKTLDRLSDNNPGRMDIKLHLAMNYFKKNDYASSQQILKKLIKSNPDNGFLYYLFTLNLYFENKNSILVEQEIKKSIKNSTSNNLKEYSTAFLKFLSSKQNIPK